MAGKDVLIEYGGQGLYEPLDLQIAKCKLMTAGAIGVPEPLSVFVDSYQTGTIPDADILAKGALEYSTIAKEAQAILNLANTAEQVVELIPL